MDEPKTTENPSRARRERTDWSFRTVGGFAIGLLFLLGVSMVALGGLFIYLATHQAKSEELPSLVTPEFLQETLAPQAPILQAVPGDQLKSLHATEDSLLNSYGWVDQQNGIVHIPIQRAIDLMAGTQAAQPTPTATPVELREVP